MTPSASDPGPVPHGPWPEEVLLPWTTLTLGDARQRLAGWHFSKELLTSGEREILYVAEAVLRLVDQALPGDRDPEPTDTPPPQDTDDAAPQRTDTAGVWVDAARLSGEPCVLGTRLAVVLVGETVRAFGVDAACDLYAITRPQALVACWYLGAYGRGVLHRSDEARDTGRYASAPDAPWSQWWGAWAEASADALWHDDYDRVPDPPTRASSPGDTANAGT